MDTTTVEKVETEKVVDEVVEKAIENTTETVTETTETELSPHLAEEVAKEIGDEVSEVEQLKARLSEFETKFAGVDDRGLEFAKNPNLYIEKTQELRRATQLAVPEDKELAVKTYLVESGIVAKEKVDKHYQRLFSVNNSIIENYDKELANDSETELYEKAVAEKAEIEAELQTEYEKAKSFLEAKREQAQEELEKFSFASTTKQVSAFLENKTATKYQVGATLKEAILENGKEKEPAFIIDAEIELAPEELELAKKVALESLKTVGEDAYESTFNSVMALLNKGKIEKAIAEKAYEMGKKAVEADKAALVKEVARLTKLNQEATKAKNGLVPEKAAPEIKTNDPYAGVKRH